MTAIEYVHGYGPHETRRLGDQADTLADLLHAGTAYPPGSRVLEVGCGVGAQTAHLVRSSPGAHLTSIDVDERSLALARARVGDTVDWRHADLFDLAGEKGEEYDHAFVCFVLEHLREPERALERLRRIIRPGGTITVIEGDHGSAFFHPDSPAAHTVIDCLVTLQRRAGGDALIGRRVEPLLTAAGYHDVRALPCTVYADRTRPALVEGFTRNTFTAMVAGVRDEALAAGLVTETEWRQGIAALERTAEPGGTFLYTFFKGTAVN
ncbi:MAG: methyltransferase domain-containing protein [Actinophytocola sp.]|uniref:methyltransferase domain-containing protein n=1 Tax=Actinophytocola sp. TaxID=1872138 RepID=UPI003D6BE459